MGSRASVLVEEIADGELRVEELLHLELDDALEIYGAIGPSPIC